MSVDASVSAPTGQVGFDCSPKWEPFDRKIAEQIAPFVRNIVWDNADKLTSSGLGLFGITVGTVGLCHVINAVGAAALRELVHDGVGIQVHPVVARWMIVSPSGDAIGVLSWGDDISIYEGRFHAAVACVDHEKTNDDNGVTIYPVAYVDFAVADVVNQFQSKGEINRLAVAGELFCSWDNLGIEAPTAVYIPPENLLECGPLLGQVLEQDEEVIQEMGKMVVSAYRRAKRPF